MQLRMRLHGGYSGGIYSEDGLFRGFTVVELSGFYWKLFTPILCIALSIAQLLPVYPKVHDFITCYRGCIQYSAMASQVLVW